MLLPDETREVAAFGQQFRVAAVSEETLSLYELMAGPAAVRLREALAAHGAAPADEEKGLEAVRAIRERATLCRRIVGEGLVVEGQPRPLPAAVVERVGQVSGGLLLVELAEEIAKANRVSPLEALGFSSPRA